MDRVAYTLFCDEVLSLVVGRNEWKVTSMSKKISEFVTVSDEAFGLLLMENSWELWKQMGERARKGEDIGNAKRGSDDERGGLNTKFTMNGGHVKKNQGWSKEGLQRFVALVKEVQDDRNTNNAKTDGTTLTFEEEYMAKQNTKKKRKREEQLNAANDNGNSDDDDDGGDYMYFEAV